MSRLDHGRLCAVDPKRQQGEQRYIDAFPESSEPCHIPVPAYPAAAFVPARDALSTASTRTSNRR